MQKEFERGNRVCDDVLSRPGPVDWGALVEPANQEFFTSHKNYLQASSARIEAAMPSSSDSTHAATTTASLRSKPQSTCRNRLDWHQMRAGMPRIWDICPADMWHSCTPRHWVPEPP